MYGYSREFICNKDILYSIPRFWGIKNLQRNKIRIGNLVVGEIIPFSNLIHI